MVAPSSFGTMSFPRKSLSRTSPSSSVVGPGNSGSETTRKLPNCARQWSTMLWCGGLVWVSEGLLKQEILCTSGRRWQVALFRRRTHLASCLTTLSFIYPLSHFLISPACLQKHSGLMVSLEPGWEVVLVRRKATEEVNAVLIASWEPQFEREIEAGNEQVRSHRQESIS